MKISICTIALISQVRQSALGRVSSLSRLICPRWRNLAQFVNWLPLGRDRMMWMQQIETWCLCDVLCFLCECECAVRAWHHKNYTCIPWLKKGSQNEQPHNSVDWFDKSSSQDIRKCLSRKGNFVEGCTCEKPDSLSSTSSVFVQFSTPRPQGTPGCVFVLVLRARVRARGFGHLVWYFLLQYPFDHVYVYEDRSEKEFLIGRF